MINETEIELKTTKQCPYCKSEIPIGAKKCRQCQSDLRNWLNRHPVLTVLGVFIMFIIVISIIGSRAKKEGYLQLPGTQEASIEEIKNTALKNLTYDELLRNNEKYVGKIVYYRGKIGQVTEILANSYILRVFVIKGEYDIWDDDIWVNYKGERVLENDIVDVWGEVKGVKKYTTVLGASRSIPELETLYLEVVKEGSEKITPKVEGQQLAQEVEKPACEPSQEICDSIDNDCDGQIDEGGVCKIPEPEIINLSGSEQQASQKFSLEKGLSIFRMTHSGQRNFAIKLLDNNGQYVELLVNEISSFNGAKAVEIESKGIYLLDISADGQWSVKIEQPRPSTAQSIPKTFTGKSQQVSEVFNLNKGLIIFKMTHDGSRNFAIKLLDENGGYVELLVNEIGNFSGSKAVGIEKTDIYLLNISADGNWSIAIE